MIRSIMTKFIKKKYFVLEDDTPKKVEDIISINPLRSEVSFNDTQGMYKEFVKIHFAKTFDAP